jgi:hypothetical protein
MNNLQTFPRFHFGGLALGTMKHSLRWEIVVRNARKILVEGKTHVGRGLLTRRADINIYIEKRYCESVGLCWI